MIPVGPSILVSNASPASSDYLIEGVDFFGRVANCASDEMIGETTAFHPGTCRPEKAVLLGSELLRGQLPMNGPKKISWKVHKNGSSCGNRC
jgi:hypothetical protein